MKCEVCNSEEAIGVCSVPGIPYSAAYCQPCLDCNAHPLHIMIGGTAINGSLTECADWWKDMVSCTCSRLGIEIDDFNKRVEASVQELNSMSPE